MLSISRTDTSLLGRWWWTIDRWQLAALFTLAGFGVVLMLAASPAVAERIGLDDLYFVRRHFVLLPVAVAAIVGVSLCTPNQVRHLALTGFAVGIVLMVVTLVGGVEIKGARRWLNIAGFSLQASEFIKPTFAVVLAWLLSRSSGRSGWLNSVLPGGWQSLAIFGLLLVLLAAQPDVGQAFVVTAIWVTQLFLSGLSLWLLGVLVVAGAGGLVGAYFFLPHVTRRVDGFLRPETADTYQIQRSLEAFVNGGWFGRGPGEGEVKNFLPDAHADFVFAVAGEELGMLMTMIIVILFAFVVLRGFSRVVQDTNQFVLLAVAGLLTQFGLQALINMGSTLNLIPPKGTTLPLISYGGSSLLAVALGLGMMLALTRRRVGTGETV